MMNDNDDATAARERAQKAALIDFPSALEGLLRGHAISMRKMEERLAKKDMSFLMALTLTQKGAKLDKDGMIMEKIAEGIQGLPTCRVEADFLDRVNSASQEGQ